MGFSMKFENRDGPQQDRDIEGEQPRGSLPSSWPSFRASLNTFYRIESQVLPITTLFSIIMFLMSYV